MEKRKATPEEEELIKQELEKYHSIMEDFLIKNRFILGTITVARGIGSENDVRYSYTYLNAKLADGTVISSRKKIDEKSLDHEC